MLSDSSVSLNSLDPYFNDSPSPKESSLQYPCPCIDSGLDHEYCFDQWDISRV